MRPYYPLLIAAATLVSTGCGGDMVVSLGQLADSQQAYAGQRVRTGGVVRNERDPDGRTYFVLADSRGTLVGLEPAATASRFEGRNVQVSGLFEIQPGFGRLIHIATIVPAKAPGG